uniref:Uncharacterized protein n=1 Tax=Clastoptera arizonana TaxID=38151 RepID=A0A1B6CYU0_9HEMI
MSMKNLNGCFYEPVNSDSSLSSIRDLLILLRSCIGPKSMKKFLITSGGYVELTSNSQTIADRLEVNNPICRYILQSVKVKEDFGFFEGVLILSMLEQIWTKLYKELLPIQKVINTFEELTKNCNNIMKSTNNAFKVDFNSAKDLVHIVKNVIISKKCSILTDIFIETLCGNIVKSFLMSINEDFIIKRISVKVEQGSDCSYSHNGILYSIVDDYKEEVVLNNLKQSNKTIFSVILFTIMLNNENETTHTLEKILQFLQTAVKQGINLVACQKTVHDSIKLFLRRNGVILLERMGSELANNFKEMTNTVPLSNVYKLKDICIDNVKGLLTSIDIIQFNEKQYFLLNNKENTMNTLVLCTSNLTNESDFKLVIEQALATLRGITTHPYLLPGAGCFEVWFSVHLQRIQVLKGSLCLIEREITLCLQKALILASGQQYPFTFDSVYHHSWPNKNFDQCKCNCGMVSNNNVSNHNGKWIEFNEHTFVSEPAEKLNKISFEPSDCVVMDSAILKNNAFSSALEMCSNLLSVGLVVYKN